jgi:hypothetical protein
LYDAGGDIWKPKAMRLLRRAQAIMMNMEVYMVEAGAEPLVPQAITMIQSVDMKNNDG